MESVLDYLEPVDVADGSVINAGVVDTNEGGGLLLLVRCGNNEVEVVLTAKEMRKSIRLIKELCA